MSNIKVAVRIRPISEREVNITGAEIVVHADGNEVSLTNLKVSASKAGDSRKRTRRYGFDYCFNSSSLDSEAHASQEKVYEKLGRSALDALFSGFNACLVAYGQSASGKTYTMMGPKNDPGLTPRLCEGLFFRIIEEEKKGSCYDTAVSYLEIYNERVRDLLKPSTNSGGLRVREHPRLGPYVQGLTRHTVTTLGSLMSYVEEGTRARKTASTSQNPTSSRSHALLTVSLTSRSENSSSTASTTGIEKKQHGSRGARLHLVDLAGSERAGNSNYGLHRLKEGANINKSLVALGNVISALAERGATGSGPGRRFIPYRDSALTWLLKDALGGNATTIMLATISPASGSYNETAHTLRFAQRAQSVVNRPVVNEDPVARVIRELRAEISRLTSLLSEKGAGGEDSSSCCCKRRLEIGEFPADVVEDIEDASETIASENDDVPDVNVLTKVDNRASSGYGSLSMSTLHRRWSSDESLSSKRPVHEKESRSPRRFGSLKSLDLSSEEAVDFPKEYDRAKPSSISYDRVNTLALVDIPTLVAVLIKPDDNLQSGSVQIEEISSESILENSGDIEVSENLDALELDALESRENGDSSANLARVITPINDHTKEIESEALASSAKDCGTVFKNYLKKERTVKQDGIDSIESKKSSNLNNSKRFGSSESFDSIKRSEGNGLGQRSYTTSQLERNRVQSSIVNSVGKSKRNWSPRGSTWTPPRKVELGEREVLKKIVQDVEKPHEIKQQKSRNPLRKQDSDSPKRKLSKDGPSKEESVPIPTPKLVRKGSVASELTSRVQTPIQRTNRRAEIVAAVTERLYSTKKAPEEVTTNSPGPEFRSPESTEIKMANTARMKLQEISRKMLAKRRRTCVDTQTDVASTVRVKDTASITDSIEVETKDTGMITDLHEDCREISSPDNSGGFSVTRVKEIATLTETFARAVRCKDVGVITEDYDADAVPTPGIFHTASFRQREPSFAENSTNTTRLSQNRCSGSQTAPEDVLPNSSRDQKGCSGCHNVKESCYQVPVSGSAERSVICITLPDMLSITIESPNTLESKIAVTESTVSLAPEERITSKVRDGETQTENHDKSTTTDLSSNGTENKKLDNVMPSDLSAAITTRSTSCQSDGKTFRIENIFKDPKSGVKTIDRTVVSELMPDLTEHVVPKTSLKLTNSIGTSFTPETTERSTEIERVNFFDQRLLGQLKDVSWRELPNHHFFSSTWKRPSGGIDPSRCRSVHNEVPSSPLPSTWPVLSPARLTTSGSKFHTEPFMKKEPAVEINTASVPRLAKYTCGKLSPLKSVAKIEAQELKSPLLVARLISNNSLEMDSSFSDDSLDHDDPSPEPAIKNANLRLDDSLCPPDVVAHTKKDVYESRVEDDFSDEVVEFPRSSVTSDGTASRVHDYESLVLGRNSFIPICQDSGETSRIETPESEEGRNQFKKKVSFSNFKLPDRPQANETRKPKPIIKNKLNTFAPVTPCVTLPGNDILHEESEETRSSQSMKTQNSNASTPLDCSTSENSFRDDISSISGSSETIRSGTLYNSDEDSDAQLVRRKREQSEMKRVRFTNLLFDGERGESVTSDSDGCEHAVSDEESICCDIKGEVSDSMFASYLDEATAFVHNMNTINDYVNASRFFQEDKDDNEDYIEYKGCRISLRDDTDEYLKQDTFNVPIDSYKNCLRGIEKLENCIEKAVIHDKFLIDKYGVRLESATTSYRLVDPGKDSNRLGNAGVGYAEPATVPSFQNAVDFGSSVEDLTGITDEEVVDEDNNQSKKDPGNMERNIFEQLMESASPRRRSGCAKPYFRRSSRMSDLSEKEPASYSRIRKKYSNLGSYQDYESLQDSKRYMASSDSGSMQTSVEVGNDRDLKIPQCFLLLPDTGKATSGQEYRNDGCTSSGEAVGTSSDSIDTVASVRTKFRYPGSPRAKLLQLVSERRQIVHRSRTGSPR